MTLFLSMYMGRASALLVAQCIVPSRDESMGNRTALLVGFGPFGGGVPGGVRRTATSTIRLCQAQVELTRTDVIVTGSACGT